MRKLLFLCVLLVGGVVQAATVTIDFQEYCGDTDCTILTPIPDPVTSQEFTFGGGGIGYQINGPANNPVYTATTQFIPVPAIYGSYVSQITFERTDGAAFALHSLDLHILNGYLEGGEGFDLGIDVLYQGFLAGGSSFTTEDIGEIGQGDWLNIVGVAISTQGPSTGDVNWDYHTVQLDNVVAGAAVPVPAAVWLFGSALAGLAVRCRRRAAGS